MKKIAIGGILALVVLTFMSRNALLYRGVRNGQPGVTSFALALGAGVNSRASDGSTPLTAAAEAGNIDAVNKLLARNAIVDWRHRETGATPLMLAASQGHAEIVDALLSAGASLTERDKENRTAYWHAFRNRQFAIARKVHWVPRREMKTAYAGGGGGGSESGGGYDSGGYDSSADVASTDAGSESASTSNVAIPRAASMVPNVPRIEPWKPQAVDKDLTAEEADAALVNAGHVVDWKPRGGNVVETNLTEEQQKVIDEAKRKKREEKKWDRKDN